MLRWIRNIGLLSVVSLALAGCSSSVDEVGPTEAKDNPEGEKAQQEALEDYAKEVQDAPGMPPGVAKKMQEAIEKSKAGAPNGEK